MMANDFPPYIRSQSHHRPSSHHPLGCGDLALAHWQVAPLRSLLRAKISHTKLCLRNQGEQNNKQSGTSIRHHAQSMSKENPVHIAALYGSSCADRGALSLCTSRTMSRRLDCAPRTALNTIVDTLTPIAEPISVIAWKSAPATLCSCGCDTLETNIVPAENVKSSPRATRHAGVEVERPE